jgi:hypothetical protein
MPSTPLFPRPVWVLIGLYFLATLMHFAHNAEYIAFYPNMPHWLTREKVYLAWLAVSSVGVAAVALGRLRFPVSSTILLAAYGALGLDGLGHYALALCSEHTFVTNFTIGFEATAGLALLFVSSVLVTRRIAGQHHRNALPGSAT